MKVLVIIGSIRQGRVSDRLGKWVATEAKALEGADIELVDLADYDLPMFDEAISPQYNPNRKPVPEVKKWLDEMAEGDAFVLVTPEYNRSYPAVLKNALDYIDFQLAKKPVALVAHGSTGGAQAVAHLRGVLPGLKSFTTPTATYLSDRVADVIDEEGNLSEEVKARPYGPHPSLQATLGELKWYSDALSAARAKDK
ncbi:MAG: NADPH-dependent reductase [Candidatus Saccharibacteria bacterium]|nr:NADPH-dependent reductase [Candidatus Saccharibacteria bacterium]